MVYNLILFLYYTNAMGFIGSGEGIAGIWRTGERVEQFEAICRPTEAIERANA